MKKLLMILLVISVIFCLAAQPAFAGGDKVRGDNGIGSVIQNGPCPFGVDTPPITEP